MSEETKVQDKSAEKMDVLFQKVYVPSFVEKLAEYGVELQTEEDLHEALKIAALTRVHAEATEEQPEQRSILKEAASRLEAITLGDSGMVNSILQDPDVAAVFQS